MQKTEHCVFWIPTKHNCNDWGKISSKYLCRNISDDRIPLYIYIYKHEKSNNITLKHLKSENFIDRLKLKAISKKNLSNPLSDKYIGKVENSIDLQCLRATPNGFFLYKYEYEIENVNITNLAQTIKSRAMYHLVKKLFNHEHEYHCDTNDSILRPFYEDINENTDIISMNNPAIKFFLKRFSEYFNTKLNCEITSNCDSFSKLIKDRKKRGRSAILRHSDIAKMEIREALGVFSYSKILIQSTDNSDSETKKYIKSIYDSVDKINRYNEELLGEFAFLSSHLSVRYGWLSYYFGILSIILGFIALPSSFSLYANFFSSNLKNINHSLEIPKSSVHNDSVQILNLETKKLTSGAVGTNTPCIKQQ